MDRRPVQTMVGQRSRRGACLCVGVMLGAITAQAAPVAPLSPDDAWNAWRIYEDLRGGTRLQHNLNAARDFLERHGAAVPAETWGRIAAFGDRPADGEATAARRAAESQFRAAVESVAQQLLEALPAVTAVDRPDDNGQRLVVLWRPRSGVRSYRIERQEVGAASRDGAWQEVGRTSGAARRFEDERGVRPGRALRYRVLALPPEGPEVALGESAVVAAQRNWWHGRRLWHLALLGVLAAIILALIWQARRGRPLKIRRIAGLEAIGDAVGRAA
jgi:hypothetical protein